MKEKLVEIVKDELLVLKQSGVFDSLPDSLDEESALFGMNGFLDSLGLVNLVVALEGRVQEEFGVAVALADDRAVSQRNSPFRTIGSLVLFIEDRIKEQEDE